VVEDTFRHEAVYLVAEAGSEWKGVLALFRVKSPILGQNMISIPYAVYGGVLSNGDDAESLLLNEAQSLGRRIKADYVELRERQNLGGTLKASDLYVTFRADLPTTSAEVLPALPKRARAEVRRARDKFDLRFEQSRDLAAFYRLFVANKTRLGSPSLPFRWFRALEQEFGSKVVLHMVKEPDGTAIGSVMSFCLGGVVYAYYSGSLFHKNSTGVNNFMYCRLMEWAVDRGFRTFDFGRSRRDSGPAAFKKNMGFDAQPLYYQYCLLKDSARLPEFNPSNPKLALPRRLWSHLPPIIARGLSGPLSKYLP
jgi:FemAB-related protein (PEP-CTERM system-associated)